MKHNIRGGPLRDLTRLAGLVRPHWRHALLGAALALAAVLANLGLLALSSWFIASMAIAGSIGAAMEYGLPAAAVRALAVARAGARYAERLANHDATFRILASLRVWFFKKIEPLAPARLAGFQSGDLLARIGADIDALDDYYVRGLVPAVVAILTAVCLLPFLACYDRGIALIDGAALAAAGLAAPLALAAWAARPGREKILIRAELRASVVEEAEGMAELIALGAVDAHARRLDELSHELDRRQRKLHSILGLGDASMSALSALAVWGATLILTGLVSAGVLAPADLAMLSVLVLASFESIQSLPIAIQKAGEMAQAARRLFEIIDAEPAVNVVPERAADASAAVASARSAAESAAVRGARGAAPGPRSAAPAADCADADLSVRDLRFRYAPGLPLVFDGLSFDLPSGSRLALAGPSGVGKSSLVSLLLRFWDYEGGRIELGGSDMRSFAPDEARRYFSAVPQAPFLFHASIRDNLLLAARPDGGAAESGDEDRLLEAAEAAGLSQLMSRLSEGLDTIVGERGRAVSVGELQRIALARAFLKPAPIYLFDEVTEGLDDKSAGEMLEAIDARLAGASILIISHRERDLELADSVLTLEQQPGFMR